MTKFNTGNPVGSSDPRDLFDNASVADNLVTGEEAAYNDRLGKARKSWKGFESEFAAFIAASGYEFVGDYAAGIEITGYQQLVRDSAGEFWRPSGSTALPYTTTGAGLPEGGNFVAVGDAYLRQDLESSAAGKGASVVKTENGNSVQEELDRRTVYVGSVPELEALSPSSGNQAILIAENRTQAFKFKSSDQSEKVTEDESQRYIVAPSSDPTGASGAWIAEKLDFQDFVTGRDFVELANAMTRPERVFARKIDVDGEDRLVISIMQSPESESTNNKYLTEYVLREDSDGLLKLHTIKAGLSYDPSNSYYSLATGDVAGAWTESDPNWFTTEVGAVFSFNSASDAEDVRLSFYTDDRGGLWNIQVVSASGEIVAEKKVSVFASVAGNRDVWIARGLSRGTYTVRGEFLGQDPFNTPTATARGWIRGGTGDTARFVNYSQVGTLQGGSSLLMSGSVYEFAIKCRPEGSTDPFNWIPDHGETGSALTIQARTYIYGKDADSIQAWRDLPLDEPVECDEFVMVQALSGTHIASSTLIAGIQMQHNFTKKGLKLSQRFRFFADTEQEATYLFMMPSNADTTPHCKIAALASDDVLITASKDGSNSVHYPGVGVARWGTDFAAGRPVLHCATIDTMPETLGGPKNFYREQDLSESLLFSDRADSVSKVYHYYAKPNTVIPSGTYVSTSVRITAGIARSPISSASSQGVGTI